VSHGWGAFAELLVVVIVVGGFGIRELVALRIDRRRSAQAPGAAPTTGAAGDASTDASKEASRHPEG
jgi:hypothetical protein